MPARLRHPIAVAVTVAALIALAAIALAAPAQALTLRDVRVEPTTTQAAAHPRLTVSFAVGASPGANLLLPPRPEDRARTLALRLPPGLTGAPTAAARCTQAQFAADTCPAASEVGTTTVSVTAYLGILQIPLTADGGIYNLDPEPDEPGRLGIIYRPLGGLLGKIRTQSSVKLRAGDYGIDTVTDEDFPLPETSLGLPIRTTGVSLTLKDQVQPSRPPFLSNPTSCGENTVRVELGSYGGTTASGEDSFTTTGCEAVPSDPSFAITPAVQPARLPGEVTTTLTLPPDPTDKSRLTQAHAREARVVLPVGTAYSTGLARGVEGCSDEQFAADSAGPSSCPAASQIGEIEYVTPLAQEPIPGAVYIALPRPGVPLRLFILVDRPGLRLKLTGRSSVDPQTGQITTTLEELARVPFTSFRFTFYGGEKAVLRAPATCGTNTGTATTTPWNANPPTTVPASFETVDCPAPAFGPQLGLTPGDPTAGASTPLSVRIDRADTDADLRRARISLPPGLLGRLGDVPGCDPQAARAGSCPQESRLGEALIGAGTGPGPPALRGDLYLTGPVDGGIAGLAVIAPTKVGPLDFGNAVSLSSLSLRPDAGLDVAAEFPPIVGGIPLSYQSIDLRIDRPGFLVNPTSCAALGASALFTGPGGEQANAQAPYQATGCERLPFAPGVTAVIDGATATGARPALTTAIEQPPGGANVRSATVTLPAGVTPDGQALARACGADHLAAGSCPASARVGAVAARTPLLPFPLTGEVLLARGGGPLPDLVVDLSLGLRLRGSVSIADDGRLRASFPAIPDVPLARLELAFRGGRDGVLVAARDLCEEPGLRLDAAFVAHSGAERSAPADVERRGCGTRARASARPRATVTLSGVARRRPVLRIRVSPGGRATRSVGLTLPASLRVASAAAARRRTTPLVGGRRAKGARVRITGRRAVSLSRLTTSRRRTVELRLRSGALVLARRLRAGQRVTVRLRVTDATGGRTRLAVRTRARR